MVKVWMVGEENTELFICTSVAHMTHTSVLLNSPLMSNQTFLRIQIYQGGPGRVAGLFSVGFRFKYSD